MYQFQHFLVPHMHTMLVGDELFQTRPVFHRSQLTDALSKRLADIMPPEAQLRVSRDGLMTADSAAIPGPFYHHFSILRLDGPTSTSPILHRATAADGVSDVPRDLIKSMLQDDSSGPLLELQRLFFHLRSSSRQLFLDISHFPSIDPNCNLNVHDALLGKSGFPTPNGKAHSKEGIFLYPHRPVPPAGLRQMSELSVPHSAVALRAHDLNGRRHSFWKSLTLAP
jgi:hypothetical protein